MGKNVVSLGVDNRSSVHIDNKYKEKKKKEKILVLGEGPAQELDDTAVTA